MPRSVLLCPPTYFDVREVKNPYMRPLAQVDPMRAQHQWQNLRDALQLAGLQVELIDPVKELEDMVFAANQLFVGESAKVGKFVVPSRMRYVSRRKEVPYFVDWFRKRGYKVLELDLGDEFLEGHGDLLWDADRSRVFAGFGFRSSRGGVEKFANAMKELQIPVVPLELTDENFYHLDTALTLLKPGAALMYPGAFSPAALDSLRKSIPRLYEVDREDALNFACNGVVANGKYIGPQVSTRIAQALNKEGLEAVVVDTSEFLKSGGSTFCMALLFD